MSRIGIQILSYNRPHYLIKTLESVYAAKSGDDIVCVIEQSDQPGMQDECLKICSQFKDLKVIPLFKNFGQRGATNLLYQTKFWDTCDYVMLSDHDNIFHTSLTKYCDILDNDPNVFVATGYISPEHDIENKKGEWIYKSTARAGHMVLRKRDFYTVMPTDPKAGSASWFAGLDWCITHWHKNSPGMKRNEFIACLPGGVEHIGRESTWQGTYDDEVPIDDFEWLKSASLYEIIQKYPPRHTYINGKYWYENITDDEFKLRCGPKSEDTIDLTIDEQIEKYINELRENKCIIIINENGIEIKLDSPNDAVDKLLPLLEQKYKKTAKVSISNQITNANITKSISKKYKKKILAFNYIWPTYNYAFLESSISSIIDFVDKYAIVINTYSYTGNAAPQENINYVNNICSKFGDKIDVIYFDTEDKCKQADKDNIGFFFKYIANLYETQNYDYLFMVQSDEVYELDTIELIRNEIENAVDENSKLDPNRYHVFTPLCYIDNPHWVVNPPENFTRPTLISFKLLKLYKNDIRRIENTDVFSVIHRDITFHHFSYVLKRDELDIKFTNWGHRDNITEKEKYFRLLEYNKTNKYLTGLHPIDPGLYDSVKFVNSDINSKCFLEWCKYLIQVNPIYDQFGNFFNHLDPYFPDDPINQYTMTIDERRLYAAMISNFIPRNGTVVEFGCWNGYNMLLTKLCAPDVKYIGVDNYSSPDKLFSQYSEISPNVYKFALKTQFNYNLYNSVDILNGDHKMLSILPNNSVDLFYLNNGLNTNVARNCIIEIWPKLKDSAIICGHYSLNDDIKKTLQTLISNDTFVNCPWGQESFNFYEIYYSLLTDIADKFSDFKIDTHFGIWFARVNKSIY